MGATDLQRDALNGINLPGELWKKLRQQSGLEIWRHRPGFALRTFPSETAIWPITFGPPVN